jgi:D-3-phosphoglycerate dehydrogenase / 2-oxoglutarate reductase
MATAATNKKKVLVTETFSASGMAVLKERSDVETLTFPNAISAADFNTLLKQHAPVHAVALGGTSFGENELNSSGDMRVVTRIGVGFDAVDIPSLNKRKIPLMTTGIANSPSVAEAALFMMLALAKRGAELDAMVKQSRWADRVKAIPFDVLGKTVMVVGFGRIGTRTVRRCLAMEMNVVVYDPYKPAAEISAAGAEAVSDLDAALPRADFVSIHCPKSPETVGMFNAARLSKLKPSAYLINTARGGIVDEAALHAALTTGKLAGAGLDVFASEPPKPDNPLFKLDTVITAPHLAGVTREAQDRMSLQTAKNILSVFDGDIIRDNVVNKEALG